MGVRDGRMATCGRPSVHLEAVCMQENYAISIGLAIVDTGVVERR